MFNHLRSSLRSRRALESKPDPNLYFVPSKNIKVSVGAGCPFMPKTSLTNGISRGYKGIGAGLGIVGSYWAFRAAACLFRLALIKYYTL